MKPSILAATLATMACLFSAPARADETGSFVVRLGLDTTSVETYRRSANRLEIDQVGRAPRVLRRHFVYDLGNGGTTKLSMVVTPPASTTPTQTIEAAVEGDSIRIETKTGDAAVQKSSVAFPAKTTVIALASPWAVYEGQIQSFVRSKRDSSLSTVIFLGSGAPNWLRLSKLGRDSIDLFNERGDIYHVRVDKAGRILGVLPIAGTAKVSVQRVDKLDLPALAAGFAAREQAGAGLGVLSPRDSVVLSNVGGASLWIDYGRPAKRGRTVFGGVVPYGEVWRTGANAATQFRTDKALDFSGTVVPPGFYTLWTIPSPTGWKLIVNGETGQWGTAHKAEKDLYTIDMKVTPLPSPVERFTISVDGAPQGGTLNMDWDTTRAAAAFTVKP
jgi:hypothetical protein